MDNTIVVEKQKKNKDVIEPKKVKRSRPPSKYNLFVKEYMKKCDASMKGTDKMKLCAQKWKEQKEKDKGLSEQTKEEQ